ncbi:MAG: hypothetical protein ACPIOQ_01140 [Promethearchaeia archaeon]
MLGSAQVDALEKPQTAQPPLARDWLGGRVQVEQAQAPEPLFHQSVSTGWNDGQEHGGASFSANWRPRNGRELTSCTPMPRTVASD